MKIFKSTFHIVLIGLILFLFACEKNECVKCDLEPDPGLGKAHFPKYYFDKEEQKCKEFIWGGYDGVVPFDTIEECQSCGCSH